MVYEEVGEMGDLSLSSEGANTDSGRGGHW